MTEACDLAAPSAPPDDRTIREWTVHATHAMAQVIASAPSATVPAYPAWQVRNLAVHVVRVCKMAAVALRAKTPERPSTEPGVAPDDDPAVLASAVVAALMAAHEALAASREPLVWTPVGVRSRSFWLRRLLREAVLHRWDAEAAAGVQLPPSEAPALELIGEFLETDLRRAFDRGGSYGTGRVTLRAGESSWIVDLAAGTMVRGRPVDDDDAVSGDPASLWLWLVGRDLPPGAVSIRNANGSSGALEQLVASLGRPSR